MADEEWVGRPLLEVRGLTKRFSGVAALSGVNFDLRPGEIHAICGENGAGKSTLIKLLSGIHPVGTYEGEILIGGEVMGLGSVRDAERAGMAVITQELAMVDELSVGENLFLGRAPMVGWRIDWLEMHRRAAVLLEEFGLEISSETLVGDLGIGQKQLVEIIRAIDKQSKILVLDEPTAALSDVEVGLLLGQLRELRRQGTSAIYISHKLDEVFSIADRVTILRDGRSMVTMETAETTISEVIERMVGREISTFFPRGERVASEEILLSAEGLTVSAKKGWAPCLRGITFELRAGEVLGFGGLIGAGRTELLRHLFSGWGYRVGGEARLLGKPLVDSTPGDSIERGMTLVSEDRKRDGLVLGETIGFNLSLSSLRRFTGVGWRIDAVAEAVRSEEFFRGLRVKASGLDVRVGGLSGGNQQKVVLGKALMTEPRVVLLDEPTRGIDVGAKLEVYELINRLAGEGKAVILVSSELPELMGMSDRIIQLAKGEMGGEFRRGEWTEEKLLGAAMGRQV